MSTKTANAADDAAGDMQMVHRVAARLEGPADDRRCENLGLGRKGAVDMTHAEIAATVKVTAELMGGKCPSEDAMTVLCNRLRAAGKRHQGHAEMAW